LGQVVVRFNTLEDLATGNVHLVFIPDQVCMGPTASLNTMEQVKVKGNVHKGNVHPVTSCGGMGKGVVEV